MSSKFNDDTDEDILGAVEGAVSLSKEVKRLFHHEAETFPTMTLIRMKTLKNVTVSLTLI